MKQNGFWKGFGSGLVLTVLIAALCVTATATSKRSIQVEDGIGITLNGARFTPRDAAGKQVPVFLYNGTTYVPVHMKAISDGLRRELEAIAAAKGIDMQKVDAVSGKGCAVKPSARYSTLQDLDAGRHTEIDMFSGTLIRMGKELGIPTPYNEFAYHMIKALEEKNDGKFDYTGPNQEMTWAK